MRRRPWSIIVDALATLALAVAFAFLFGLVIDSIAEAAPPKHGTTAYRAYVIRKIFGPVYGDMAVRVARCESGPDLQAGPGAHAGTFQVSKALRRDYPGYGPGIWRKARHAYRVFNASGKNWDAHWRWSKACWG